MATSLLSSSIHTTLAQVIQQEIISRSAKYYFALGRNYSWGTANDAAPDVLDTYSYEIQARKDLVKFSEIGPNDVSIVVTRNDWTVGFVYDDYDEYTVAKPSFTGANSLETSTFYVVTDEFNVYKCLFNNNGSPSLEKPTGTQVAPIGPLSDGYIWKFMYNIPLFLRNKFLTATQMPVTTALTSQFYSYGRLSQIVVNNRGSGYTPNSGISGSVSSDISGSVDDIISQIAVGVADIATTKSEVTVKTSLPHGWRIGQSLTVTCSSHPAINGTITITSIPSSTEFVYIKTVAGAPISQIAATGTVSHGAETLRLKKLYGISTLFTDELETGSIIQIQNDPQDNSKDELYEVETIESDTELTLTRQAYIPASTSAKLVKTTIEISAGDGHRPDNPFRINSVSIVDSGSGYLETSTVVFSDPTLPNGRIAKAGLLLNESGGIIGIRLDDPGYGYASAPTVTIDDGGDGHGTLCILSAVVSATSALLEPIIDGGTGEIFNVAITNGGEGYTFSALNVRSLDSQGSGASISANINTGDLDTKQADQELLAVKGGIHIIKVDAQGNGYTAGVTAVTVVGDGSGCTAVPVINNGRIERISVVTPGVNYTSATITITGSGTSAAAHAVISPQGGHGKNAINELYGRTVLFYGKVTNEQIKTVTVQSAYRQIVLVKRPKQYNTATSEEYFYNNFSGTTCYKISGSGTIGSNFSIGTIVYITQGTAKYRYRIVAKTSNKVLVTAIDNVIDPSPGENMQVLNTNGTIKDTYGITAVELPDINRFSGEIIYIDNRQAITATGDQILTISSRFRL